jgi:hypothetical protein
MPRHKEHETRDFIVRLAVVFIIVLTILYAINREGFYAFWNVIIAFFSFFANNPQFIILFAIILLIAYLLRGR